MQPACRQAGSWLIKASSRIELPLAEAYSSMGSLLEAPVKESRRDHLGLLCSVGELTTRLAGSADIQAFLGQIVSMVANYLNSEVCSIYLYEEETAELVLRATHGLNPDAVGRVRLTLNEGLTGMAMRELRPICEYEASRNPYFKRFDDINEEPYESFLAVPIQKGVEKIGVLVLQRQERSYFTSSDVAALRAVASQLTTAIENARIFMDLPALQREQAMAPARPVAHVSGRIASRGMAEGYAAVQDPARARQVLASRHFPQRYTAQDFRHGVEQTARDMEQLQRRLQQRLPEMASMIFSAHIMMLRDPAFMDEIGAAIEAGHNPPEAVLEVGRKYVQLLAGSPHGYIREKAQDVEDVVKRLVANIIGQDSLAVRESAAARIVIARELFPSDILKLACESVEGIVLVSGGVTSHVSILARSLHIPLLIANDQRLLELPDRSHILLDVDQGELFVNPSQQMIERFHARRAAIPPTVPVEKMLPQTRTADGTRIRLLANVNLLSDLEQAQRLQAEGVGLYRTEFSFLAGASLPSEEEQYLTYRRLFQRYPDKDITFRTLDLGGDKLLAYYDEVGEENPALGLRSIRFSFRHDEAFQQQLRAILRAGAGENRLRIMFPMISSVEDFEQAARTVHLCIDALRTEGEPCCENPPLGMMVEVPSAVEIIDALAKRAAFFSVGTNDLIQFLLAVDRTNEKVASYFTPYHPSVLRAVARIVEAGLRHGTEVSICGEMAHDPRCAEFLIGIGVRVLSVDPQYLPAIQRNIGTLCLDHARRRARALLAVDTIAEVHQLIASAEAP